MLSPVLYKIAWKGNVRYQNGANSWPQITLITKTTKERSRHEATRAEIQGPWTHQQGRGEVYKYYLSHRVKIKSRPQTVTDNPENVPFKESGWVSGKLPLHIGGGKLTLKVGVQNIIYQKVQHRHSNKPFKKKKTFFFSKKNSNESKLQTDPIIFKKPNCYHHNFSNSLKE